MSKAATYWSFQTLRDHCSNTGLLKTSINSIYFLKTYRPETYMRKWFLTLLKVRLHGQRNDTGDYQNSALDSQKKKSLHTIWVLLPPLPVPWGWLIYHLHLSQCLKYLSWLHGVSLVLESSEVKRWAMGSPESRLQAASLGVPKAKMRLGVGGGA